VNESAIVRPGTVIQSPDLSGNDHFGYWELDGVRQQDAWGVAYPQFSFKVNDEDRVGVAYFFDENADSDGDGVPDAYEQYYYGNLDHDAVSDTDGDGFNLRDEYVNGTQPLYANAHQEGGIAWSDSSMVVVNLAGYSKYTLTSNPEGAVNVSEVVRDGSSITSPSMDSDSFVLR